MKTSDNLSKWLKIILGIFLIGYALNQFFHFLPSGYGKMPENSRDFIDAVAIYLPFLYLLEIIIGIFLLINKWTSFILIVLFPLSVAFVIFTFANMNIANTWPAVIVALLNIILVFKAREKYRALFD